MFKMLINELYLMFCGSIDNPEDKSSGLCMVEVHTHV